MELYLHINPDNLYYISNKKISWMNDLVWGFRYYEPQQFFTLKDGLQDYEIWTEVYFAKQKQELLNAYWKSGYKNLLVDRTI